MSLLEKVPTNRLLAALLDKDSERLLHHCQPVELVFAEELYHAGEPVLHVYFPTDSFISLVIPVDNHPSLEVGLVGNEGMFGISLMLGIDMLPFDALVQGAGSALRITSTSFLHELEQNTALEQKLKRYFYVSMSQLAQSAVCNRFHVVEARLARWLLMTQDRAHSNCFHATHVFLAYMLGVRRVGITKAANSLQKQKLISYKRGNITILNRLGLEAISCDCYHSDKEIYQRVLGGF